MVGDRKRLSVSPACTAPDVQVHLQNLESWEKVISFSPHGGSQSVALLRCFGSPGFFALYLRLWCLSSCSWQRPKHSLWKMLEKETVNTHICSVDSGLADLLRRRSKQSWKGSDCSAGELQKNGALLLCLMCKSAAVCNIGSSLRFLHKVLTGLTVV